MSLLRLDNVSFGYGSDKKVLDGVSLDIQPGDGIGLVGESGSGKTTLLRLMLGLTQPQGGSISFNGAPLDPRNAAFTRAYRRQVQIVFQDPYSSLDPRQSVFAIVAEPLRSLKIPGDHLQMVVDALVSVGLEANILTRYPHEFSGGQRQRIAIARAIVAGPSLLLADEAVSALDLSTRIRIVDLLKTLSARMTLVFVSHDIGVVAALCQKIVILERGKIVEAGPTAKILADPQHPYTQRLLASVPRMPGLKEPKTMAAPQDYLTQLDAWKLKRLADLKGPEGWLNIIGRFWLDTGTVTVGTAEDNDLVLSAGPAHVGAITQDEAGGVTFTPADGGAPQVIKLDKHHPPRFTVESLLLEVTTLNGVNALRIRDTASTAPAVLTGIESFPAKPELRIEAEWVSLETPMGMTVDTSKSIPTDVEATHKAVFSIDGTRYELFATHGTPTSPQFVIRDLTSRDSTYPASRFVFGEDVTDNTIVLDFNKAINPPCVFTEHAVCPLPPPENVLPIRIEAGEKRLPG